MCVCDVLYTLYIVISMAIKILPLNPVASHSHLKPDDLISRSH